MFYRPSFHKFTSVLCFSKLKETSSSGSSFPAQGPKSLWSSVMRICHVLLSFKHFFLMVWRNQCGLFKVSDLLSWNPFMWATEAPWKLCGTLHGASKVFPCHMGLPKTPEGQHDFGSLLRLRRNFLRTFKSLPKLLQPSGAFESFRVTWKRFRGSVQILTELLRASRIVPGFQIRRNYYAEYWIRSIWF